MSILVNTSFNLVKNNCLFTSDAINSFLKCDIETLVMDNFIVKKLVYFITAI